MGELLQFPRKPRLAIDQIFDDLDIFRRLYRRKPRGPSINGLVYGNAGRICEPREDTLPCDVEPSIIGADMASGPDLAVYHRIGDTGENNLRPDGTRIVTTGVLETRGKEPA